jgi:drug/metabolite transporter (DMT)-like permease
MLATRRRKEAPGRHTQAGVEPLSNYLDGPGNIRPGPSTFSSVALMGRLAILLVIVGNVIYHLGQRAIPRETNAAIANLAAYVVAIILTLLLLPLLAPNTPILPAFRSLNWSTLFVGSGILTIELGFLLAYRAGWPLSSASMVANLCVAVIFLGIGVIAFKEDWSLTRTAGLGCCMLGLWLINRPTG